MTVTLSPAGPRDVELAITGMTCAACAARVEKKLNRLEDVTATVNYATATARVRVPAAVGVAELIAAVERAGYGAEVPARGRTGPAGERGDTGSAANRVLLLPAGIGTGAPRAALDGRITAARCYGALVTLDPTGVVLVRPGAVLTLGDLFCSWGQPLSRTRLASFTATAHTGVTVFVNGKPWPGAPTAVPLARHAEIVLEVGAPVPPHLSYAFPPGT